MVRFKKVNSGDFLSIYKVSSGPKLLGYIDRSTTDNLFRARVESRSNPIRVSVKGDTAREIQYVTGPSFKTLKEAKEYYTSGDYKEYSTFTIGER